MQILQNKVWIGCVCLLGIHQWMQKVAFWQVVFVDNYLDAFLSTPILLGLILQERQFLITKYFNTKKPSDYYFSILEIMIATTFFAIVFEEGFPRWSAHFTKDYWDYLAYFSGAFVFYLFINKPEERIIINF